MSYTLLKLLLVVTDLMGSRRPASGGHLDAASNSRGVHSFARVMIMAELETFRSSGADGQVTGVIYLKLAGGDFPETDWSDFPVTLLGWWIDAWLQLQDAERRSAQWDFMDGPYSALVEKVPNPSAPGSFQTPEIHRSLLDTADRVLAYCETHQVPERQFESLRTNVQRLRAIPALERTAMASFISVRGSTSRR